jgi:hypothetical protein
MPTDFVPFSRKGERKISSFVGQELLFDYIIGNLDSERMTAVEDYLKANREAHSDLQRIHSGLDYTRLLAGTKVSDLVVAEIKAPSSYFQVLLRKLRFEEWSPGIKMGLEVLVVAVGVISVSLLIPWHRLMEINWTTSKEVVLAEVTKNPLGKSSGDTFAVTATVTPTADSGEVFPDDIKDKNGKTAASPVVAAAAKPESITPPVAVAPTTAPAKPAEPLPAPAAKTAPVVTAAKAEKETTKETGQHVGFLYRGSIQVTNATATSPKFVEKITELGGRKAGEVELGWKKGSSRYFHLTMPESKYQSFLDFAKAYGQLTLTKEKHERVMPEGIVRIIFTVDEKKSP